MSYWGIFHSDVGKIHVMPCDAKLREAVNDHVARTDCWCKPTRDYLASDLWHHHDPERSAN